MNCCEVNKLRDMTFQLLLRLVVTKRVDIIKLYSTSKYFQMVRRRLCSTDASLSLFSSLSSQINSSFS